MATFTVGEKTYSVGEMNFIAVERAWPDIQLATVAINPIRGSAAAISVIAAAMMEDSAFDRDEWDIPKDFTDEGVHELLTRNIKRRLKSKEMGAVRDTMMQVLREAGLEITEGELQEAVANLTGIQNPSMETVPDTSANLSPQELKEEAGIE